MTKPDIHPACLSDDALMAQCEMRRLRRSGPGGQHRNKVETAVQLVHLPSGTVAEANERRSQAVNRGVALFRLRVNLAMAVRGPKDVTCHPSPLWQSRCGDGGRISINAEHADFPAMLAEALDVLTACDDDVSQAAEVLGSTSSQLIKFLKKTPRALAEINRRRCQRGLRVLH